MPPAFDHWYHSVNWPVVLACLGLILVLLNLFQIIVMLRWAVAILFVLVTAPLVLFHWACEKLR